LLAQIGVRHRIRATEIDEAQKARESPGDYVARLAAGKARAAVEAERGRPGCPVLAADTTVVLDGSIFGKPADEAECVAMLTKLAGRRHEVLTAITLWHDGRLDEAQCASYVTFRPIDDAECRRYWATGEPAGKAGAYAIQGLGAVFVQCLEGSFSNVVGLPLFETSALLDAVGVQRWQNP
jgi:septum formation protein